MFLIIIVNVLLKGFWGRARPNDILELGGEENFSAWFQYSDACSTNCSFVSGDASVGFSLIVIYSNRTGTPVLIIFRSLLEKVPLWNSEIIDSETERIMKSSKCDWLDDLIKKGYHSL